MNLSILTVGAINTNVYIYYNEKDGVIIDPGFDGGKIAEFVKENNIPVSKILLTHGHFDHIGGADDLIAVINVPVYVFESERQIVSSPEFNGSAKIGRRPLTCKIDGVFNDSQTIHFDGFNLNVIHTPGHTSGSCCFYDKENSVLFSGDTLFKQGIGRTDFHSGSYDCIISSINDKLLTLPKDTKVYPGHGASTLIADESTV